MMFLERTYECNRCHKSFKSFSGSDGLSIMYRHTFLSLCNMCTDIVLDNMGMSRDTVTKEWASIKELESEQKRKDEISRGDRCARCQSPFSGHHHKHVTRKGTFHTGCYAKEKPSEDGL